MTKKPNYESTVMRIAGNLIGHLMTRDPDLARSMGYPAHSDHVKNAVRVARAIVEEVQRTGPKEETP